MQALSNVLKTIGQQMRGFSPTARMLIGALMVICVLGLVIVAMFAGRSEMVPLGLGNAEEETKTRVVNWLTGRQIKYELRGDDLFVPVDQKHVTLAQLTDGKVITTDQIDFSAIIKDDSPFTDRDMRRTRYLVAKMNEVALMISELDGIDRAKVVIDQPIGVGFGVPNIESTASVSVMPRGDGLSQMQADAIARMVAGAHADLKLENVIVVDAKSGRTLTVRSEDDFASSRYLEMKQAAEEHARTTIEEALVVIPGVVVAVNAQMDATEEILDRHSFEDPKVGVREESTRERNATNRPIAGEPGIRSNTGTTLSLSAGRSSSMSDTQAAAKMLNAFGNSKSHRKDPKGYPMQINATIQVPRSHFVAAYRRQEGDETAEPDTNQLAPIVQSESDAITRLVEPLIDTDALGAGTSGSVVVRMYADRAITGPFSGEGGGLTGDGLGGGLMTQNLVKSVGLGGLALVSLMLMFMMVKKASREEELPTAEELVGIPPALAEADADIVGEADETVPAMVGLEIDEDSVRRQQIIDQINELAATNSDEAASLLRKWIKTND